jgi:hypothetical protein
MVKIEKQVTLKEAQRIAFAALEAIATQHGWENVKDLVGRELDITDDVLDQAVAVLNAADAHPTQEAPVNSVSVVIHLHAGSIYNTAVFADPEEAKKCQESWAKENSSDDESIDLQRCQIIGRDNIIGIDVNQFVNDNFSGDLPLPGIMAQDIIKEFAGRLEENLSDWIKDEWTDFLCNRGD